MLLLGLAGVLDVFEEVKHPLGVSANGAKAIYGWVPARYRQKNFYRLMKRQLETGNIERVVKNGEAYLRLTSKAGEELARDFPLVKIASSKWDGKWRAVIFDIKEVSHSTRTVLRNKLRELGFGMLQESVWITPHDFGRDMAEYLESVRLSDEVFVLEVSGIVAGNARTLINKIWDLEKINEGYREVVEKPSKQKFLETLLIDPLLPKELLPNGWMGEKARKAVGLLGH